jgi:Zn finger protein HypA/HybF involved in hydrogenase expression
VKTVRLMTSDNLAEAHIIKGRLLNEGIDCFLTNENFTNLMPLYNNMLGSGIQIIVNEKDNDKAREILKDKIEPNNLELVCPNCGSENIGLGLGKGKAFKVFNMIIALLSFFPIGNLKPKYYCKSCNTEIK